MMMCQITRTYVNIVQREEKKRDKISWSFCQREKESRSPMSPVFFILQNQINVLHRIHALSIDYVFIEQLLCPLRFTCYPDSILLRFMRDIYLRDILIWIKVYKKVLMTVFITNFADWLFLKRLKKSWKINLINF